ncbi:MAG: hypothetical protein HC794_07640, partial [Nitrospiraceae bacterium]|nr:hypothetical protein [Nitrospiraceae bacterium]
LRAFQESDAGDFFGRAAFVEQLLNTYLSLRLPGERFVAFTRRRSPQQLREMFLPAYATT